MSDPIDLDAARRLVEAAERGPWRVRPADSADGTRAVETDPPSQWGLALGCFPADAAFIASARTLVPALIDECERLRKERDMYADGVVTNNKAWEATANQAIAERDAARAESELRWNAIGHLRTEVRALAEIAAERDALKAECERMRPVVEAAVRMFDSVMHSDGYSTDAVGTIRVWLESEIHAYLATKDTP